MNFLYFLLLSLFLVCCKSNNFKYYRSKDIAIQGISVANTSHFNYITINNENYIVCQINDTLSNLLIFKENGELYKTIKIPLSISIHDLCDQISNDTLYILYNNSKVICINIHNNSIKEYEIFGSIFPTKYDYHLLTLKPSPFTKINDSSYIVLVIRHINQSTEQGRKLFAKYSHLGLLTKNNVNFHVKNIEIPNPYLLVKDNQYYMDQLLRFCYYEQNLIYFIGRSHCIYKYNFQNQTIDSVEIHSEYIKTNEIKPFENSNFYNSDYYLQAQKYAYEVPHYHRIIFNKHTKIIFRINVHKTPFSLYGKRTNYRNWSVSVIDTNLNLIGEIPFLKDSLYNFYNFIPSSKGFIVAYKQTEEDKRLKRTRLCEFEISY